LTSRCITPRECAWASAEATSMPISITSWTASGPARSTRSSGGPSTNFMLKKCVERIEPTSNTSTMLACARRPMASASRRKRFTVRSRIARLGGKTLIATRRPRLICSASNTTPIAPWPTWRSTR
jgi:hypothetical protein